MTDGEDALRPCTVGRERVWLLPPARWRAFLARSPAGGQIAYAKARTLPLAIDHSVLDDVREALALEAVHLVQRRLGDGWFLYLAQKRAHHAGRPRFVARRLAAGVQGERG